MKQILGFLIALNRWFVLLTTMWNNRFRRAFLFCLKFLAPAFFCLLSGQLVAEVTRFEITQREPFADGKLFGSVGAYERIFGRVHFELDPELPKNQHVIDLKLAPRNEQGRVELSADLLILAPVELRKGNGALLYGVNNRGNLITLRNFNDAPGSNDPKDESHAGNGFLMRHGFTVVWSGWDGELLPGNNRLQLFSPPVAKKTTGRVRCEIVPDSDTIRMVVNWDNHGSYRPTAEGIRTATLTHRLLAGHPRVLIPREDWQLHVSDVVSDSPTQLPKVELECPQGLRKLHIYELIYEAQDPVVMGTGFTSVRDVVSALKHGTGQDNPLLVDGQSPIARAHSFGVSQSGRFLREMIYWGFNEDETGKKVFDGIIPLVSGSGLGSFNHRFAQPTRHAGQHDHHDYPPDRFPFAYGSQTDPLSGRTEGILDRSVGSGTAPLVMHTQSSSEYWNRSGSLVHTDPLGKSDAEIPENVRLYFFGGTQHGPSGFTTKIGDGQTAPNPADYRPFLRTLLLALDRWAKDGTEPPPSVYPTISDGTLVPWTQIATGFPDIPGIRYPGVIQQPSFLDFGPRWQYERIIDYQPPIPRGDYHVLVPRSGPDGNELGCLSPPEVAVPVATYTSWRLHSGVGPAANQLYSLSGSYLPFPVTQAEREKTADPRQSLEERYGTPETYLGQLEAQCQTYEAAGYLLKEDTERTLQLQRERVTPLFNRQYDVVIYGGTSAGIAAAVQVKRMGGTVVVVEPGRRIGGLTTGGLGQTDIGNKAAIGGIAREFYQRVRKYYDQPTNWKWQRREEYRDGGQTKSDSNEVPMWTFEPAAALAIMQDLVREYDIPVMYEQRLDRTSIQSSGSRIRGVTLDGKRIASISTESGRTWRGRVFLDATYEGDLLAGAGIPYTVGRENNAAYDETLNGVQTQHAKYHQFVPGVDPYVTAGDASSGLLPGIDANGPGEEGSGDHRVQAFCFRMCLTDHPENRIPFVKPDGYDLLVYELLLRNFEAGETGMPWINSSMPNRKTDTNNRTAFSTDFIGYNYDYPEASYTEREAISQRHREYQQGLMWTLANHPRVPDHIRNEVARWGMCRDEFEREEGWQQQLYVREARRMIGATVMTQHHCQGRETAEDAIGLAAYTMDSHNVQRYVDAQGHVRNEGDVEVGGFSPYAISYGALTPKPEQCENLLVPVCLSASHIAFGSIRMEPVFMVLGQSAATAAMQAIEADVPVQAISYDALKEKLLADGQVLSWTGLVGVPNAARAVEEQTLKVAAFQVDVTPPLGSPLCNGGVKPAMEIVTPLTARGVVLLGADQPIVLCAFDWVGIANESHDRFREALAEAVGTTTERVALHTLHQHDAPGSDFATERLLTEHGLERRFSNADFDADVMRRVAAAAKSALPTARPVTHIGLGTGRVEQVASNRRILGPDGRVILQRQSSGGKNPAAREAPEGTIDPLVRLITFWHNDHPCAVLTYYATHPQSYYGQGSVNWDFVGMARESLEKTLPGVPVIHFDGAGGNVAAGKYNDGSKETRPVLAQRLVDGIQEAWKSQTKQPITSADVGWQVVSVAMPVRETLAEEQLMAKLVDLKAKETDRLRAARDLTFLRRTVGGHRIPITCLSLGTARILHMPGELFVEYQLAAQKMRPDNFVAMAAYGDYGPGYIGTSIAYTQGGYETGIVSRVAPNVEQVLTDAMKTLLRADLDEDRPDLFEVPEIHSSWDDLTDGIETKADWHLRRVELKKKYRELLRDEYKPQKPPLDLKVHEDVVVDSLYRRQLISYAVESDERAHAYLGIPLKLSAKAPAIVALHGTYEFGKERAAGLIDDPDKAYLDHLCRRGYVVIAPDHFVSGHRVPPEGAYETGRFYDKHPNWTAVGKFTYEHSIAVDVLQTLDQVDVERIGALGHSLGGHGTIFLAAYDERIKASACNCGASFFRHNPSVTEWSRDRWYIYFKPIREGLLKGEMPPIDFHEIIALIAPRAFMDLSGLNDGHGPTQRQRLLMLMRIMDIYELEEAPQNFGFYVHGRGHSVAHESRQLMYGWMDTHLKPPEATQTRLVAPESEAAAVDSQ